jgi:hypothetical protein
MDAIMNTINNINKDTNNDINKEEVEDILATIGETVKTDGDLKEVFIKLLLFFMKLENFGDEDTQMKYRQLVDLIKSDNIPEDPTDDLLLFFRQNYMELIPYIDPLREMLNFGINTDQQCVYTLLEIKNYVKDHPVQPSNNCIDKIIDYINGKDHQIKGKKFEQLLKMGLQIDNYDICDKILKCYKYLISGFSEEK